MLGGNSTSSAFLTDTTDPYQSVAIACQEEIPRPPLTPENIENSIVYNEAKTASATARLYHDASAKDGNQKLDQFIFRNPRTGMDIFVAGFGPTFEAIIKSVQLLP
jgi:hypothetical protein